MILKDGPYVLRTYVVLDDSKPCVNRFFFQHIFDLFVSLVSLLELLFRSLIEYTVTTFKMNISSSFIRHKSQILRQQIRQIQSKFLKMFVAMIILECSCIPS